MSRLLACWKRRALTCPARRPATSSARSALADPNSNASLTSAAFGQTFKITPVQLVRAIAAVVNGGYVLEPYIVSEVLDGDGNVVQRNERNGAAPGH